jgi:hypothetical protein
MVEVIRAVKNRQLPISLTVRANGVARSLTTTPTTVWFCVKPFKDDDSTNAASIILIENGVAQHSTTRVGYTQFTVTATSNNVDPKKYEFDVTVATSSTDTLTLLQGTYDLTTKTVKY